MGLLCLRQRSQRRLKMSVNVCLDEHFVTKFGMVMQMSVMRKKLLLLLLFLRSRSRQELIWSKSDSFYYIFWTVDSLASKLGLVIHHYKLECLEKEKWITAFRIKVTAKGQMLIFVHMISSKPPINLVLWCIIMSWSVMQKDWFAIFKVKVTAVILHFTWW